MELLEDVTAGAIIGGTEAAAGVLPLYRAYRRLSRHLAGPDRPDVLVVIDFPEFNLRLARRARRHDVPVVYFIPPQIWAWRGGRVRAMRRMLSLVLAVFPFEPALYRAAGVPVAYVGHPLVDALAGAPTRADARRRLGLPEDACVIGLLPGSRRGEIERLLPVMREAVARVSAHRPDARVVLALAPTIDAALVSRHLGEGTRVRLASAAHDVMRAADLLLATSGTATLEAALLGTPMVVCYRVSRLTALMVRSLVRVPWMTLPNIVLGRAAVPELFQEEATAARIADEALALLADARARDAQRAAFRELTSHLGDPGVSARAAKLILSTARPAS
jgi:lipid-A-disaccharide synthase